MAQSNFVSLSRSLSPALSVSLFESVPAPLVLLLPFTLSLSSLTSLWLSPSLSLSLAHTQKLPYPIATRICSYETQNTSCQGPSRAQPGRNPLYNASGPSLRTTFWKQSYIPVYSHNNH